MHTEVGHACIGARVNGRLVPLDHKLQSGDTCEIFTSKVEGAGPSRDWLKLVASPRARNKIRQWFSRERRDDAMDSGREELIKELRREGLPVQKMLASDVLAGRPTELKYTDLDALVRAIGEHHVSGKSVAQRVARRFRSGEEEEQLPVTVRTPRRQRKAKSPRRRARRGPRRRDGAALTLLHAGARATRSSASSPAAAASACTGPTAPTPCRCRRPRRRA